MIHSPVDRLLGTTYIILVYLKAVVFHPISMCLVVLQLIYDTFWSKGESNLQREYNFKFNENNVQSINSIERERERKLKLL